MDPKIILTIFIIVSILIVTIITAFSSVLTQAIEQVNEQSLNVTKQKTYPTDVNVHFKTACISVILLVILIQNLINKQNAQYMQGH
jgi:hypothetical protein